MWISVFVCVYAKNLILLNKYIRIMHTQRRRWALSKSHIWRAHCFSLLAKANKFNAIESMVQTVHYTHWTMYSYDLLLEKKMKLLPFGFIRIQASCGVWTKCVYCVRLNFALANKASPSRFWLFSQKSGNFFCCLSFLVICFWVTVLTHLLCNYVCIKSFK